MCIDEKIAKLKKEQEILNQIFYEEIRRRNQEKCVLQKQLEVSWSFLRELNFNFYYYYHQLIPKAVKSRAPVIYSSPPIFFPKGYRSLQCISSLTV